MGKNIKNKIKNKKRERMLLNECEIVLQDLMNQLKQCIHERDNNQNNQNNQRIKYTTSGGAYNGVGSLKNECTGCKARLFGQ